MTLDGQLVGQVTVAGITMGSLRGASIGYWIDSRVAGLGLTPMAVAMACDYCFGALRLHRIEIVIRPENAASLRVRAEAGLPPRGIRARPSCTSMVRGATMRSSRSTPRRRPARWLTGWPRDTNLRGTRFPGVNDSN